MTTAFWPCLWSCVFEESIWGIIAPLDRSTWLSMLILKLLFLAAGAVYYEFEVYHGRYPVRLFKILNPEVTPEELQSIADDPECMWCEFTRVHRKRFPGQLLFSRISGLVLLGVAYL